MPRYSTILSNIIARLTAQNASGKILAGFKLTTNPTTEVEGQTDLSGGAIRLIDPPDIKEKAHEQMAIITGGTVTLKLGVSTLRSAGFVAHLQAVEKAMDALETDATTGVDLLLGGTLAQPFSMNAGDSFAKDDGLSQNTFLTVTMIPIDCASGGRRS